MNSHLRSGGCGDPCTGATGHVCLFTFRLKIFAIKTNSAAAEATIQRDVQALHAGLVSPCRTVLWDRAETDFGHLKSEEYLSVPIGSQAKGLQTVYAPLISLRF